jgi:hypothetical protein
VALPVLLALLALLDLVLEATVAISSARVQRTSYHGAASASGQSHIHPPTPQDVSTTA